jgi:hypothetical protein
VEFFLQTMPLSVASLAACCIPAKVRFTLIPDGLLCCCPCFLCVVLEQRLQLAAYDEAGAGVLDVQQLQRYLAAAVASAPLLACMEVGGKKIY